MALNEDDITAIVRNAKHAEHELYDVGIGADRCTALLAVIVKADAEARANVKGQPPTSGIKRA